MTDLLEGGDVVMLDLDTDEVTHLVADGFRFSAFVERVSHDELFFAYDTLIRVALDTDVPDEERVERVELSFNPAHVSLTANEGGGGPR